MTPHPEQTASILSLILYGWMDATVWKAYRQSHTKLDDLPPLADYDHAKNLVNRAFPHLDPFQTPKRRHFFWGLMRVFRKEYAVLGLMLASRSVAYLASPVGVNRLLNYLEQGGEGLTVRPWVWIALLFIGPTVGTFAFQWYVYTVTRVTVRAKALITQLVFEHALRVRMKAETADAKSASAPSTPGKTPDTASLAEPVSAAGTAEPDSDSEETTLRGSSTAGSAASTKKGDESTSKESSGGASNLVGRINNLVTTDMQTIDQGRDFIFVFVEVPTQLALCTWFLYVVLGWSALVGMAVMGLMLPIPGYIASFVHGLQEKKMAKVHTRSLGVVRMIKLFGWEPRMAEQVAEKREEELGVIRSLRMREFLMNYMKSVSSCHVVVLTTETIVMKQTLTGMITLIHMPVFETLRNEMYQTFGMIPFIIQGWEMTPTPQRRVFRLLIEDELVFKRGCVNLILGPTGSGRLPYFILTACAGEMHYIPNGPDSYVNLPRTDGVAYSAQESWVQNETVRERYNKVRLTRDLELLDAGDLTEVGEKGLTLRYACQARITLARAIYSSAEILLLDDVLAALDQMLQGDLVRGRTIILVTHNVAITRPIADFVVSLGTDGRVHSQGSLSSALQAVDELAAEQAKAMQGQVEEEVDAPTPDNGEKEKKGKLVWRKKFHQAVLGALGGRHPLIFWFACLGCYVTCEIVSTFQVWFLGMWTRQYEEMPPEKVSVAFYVTSYALIQALTIALFSTSYIIYIIGSLRAWLDMTPASRIITRCTQDIQAIDNQVVDYFFWWLEQSGTMITRLGAVVIMSPLMLIPGSTIFILAALCGYLYINTQLSTKREMSLAQAPVLGHFGAAMAGLGTQESYTRIDKFTRAARSFYVLYQWIAIRVDALAALFTTGLGIYLIYGPPQNPSAIGFSLNMAVQFSSLIIWWIKLSNELQISGTLERIQQYLSVEQEPKATTTGVPPAYWPASGTLRVEKLSARYSPDGPRVLHAISFEVRSGERVGIVGRTGSGKSSLTLALLRCILTEGKVFYDGVATDTLNLDALRSKITIIPQSPELLSGTLRENLDPFHEHDDAVLNDALRAAGLFSLQKESDDGKITLDSQIASGGGNLSVGQRQILALARAIVRQSKLLILDEAASYLDYETDTVIQASLRGELRKDITLLTIAHRLQTIMDSDKIMVLDAGRIVEYGPPSELLKIEDGLLRSLINESADKEHLLALATGKNASTSS
ncbi:P-loop containing nucleoside triphosphate hydrolase protein [Fomitopsis serialis]|uniref:P-loop containing nucleoside triphosphate hydrolase protein n=1 Tax=Fomitopsis serialis TaxID=139415 RepID=UPI002007870B|nr:P-loop containing nucleoside triphosphate hydrolase protein [Neoantrodia serialis]KAH9932906.1 P-loop containing nucleoside triphosphate hydrolase protein [Neoantrodia serialis]